MDRKDQGKVRIKYRRPHMVEYLNMLVNLQIHSNICLKSNDLQSKLFWNS